MTLVCCHQSARRYRNGMVRCAFCSRLFASNDAWIEAIEASARTIIEQATVHEINDKGG